MRSSAVVDIGLSWSAPSHTLSSTSCGAHALICCRGHRPLEVCSLPHALSLIYQQWCSCAHLLSWASSSRGQLPPRLSHLPAVVLMRTSAIVGIGLSRSAPSPHTLLPAVVLMCSSAVVDIVLSRSAPSPPHTHTLSLLLAVVLMRSSAVVGIVLSRSAPPPHTLSHLPAVVLMRSSAVVDIVLSRSAPSPHTLSHLPAVGLMSPSAVVDILLSWSLPPTHSLIY